MNILKQATDDTSDLIRMCSSIFTVDKLGYILRDGERYLITPDGNSAGKPGLVIQDPLPNGEYFLINPYGEGAGIHSTPLNFFYRMMLAGLVQSLICATSNVLVFLVKASKKEIDKIPPEVLKVAALNKVGDSDLADVIDPRMAKEFDKIDAVVQSRILLIYPPKKMRVSLHFENMTLESLKGDLGNSVRQKTIQVYLAILYGILGINDESGLDKFTTVYNTDIKAPPKMWCFMNSLLKVYLAISGVLDDVGLFPKELDLSKLTEIIERIPEVFQKSRHVIQVEYGANSPAPAKPAAPRTQAQAVHRQPAQSSGQSFKDKLLGRGPIDLTLQPMEPPQPVQRQVNTNGIVDGFGSLSFSDVAASQGGRTFVGNSGGWETSRLPWDTTPPRTFDTNGYTRTFERSITDRRF